jgi:histidine phosphotransfer protein HptB
MALDRQALENLLEVIGGDRGSLQELIESFEKEAPRLMAAMRAAGSSADSEVLRRTAHTMKSSARDFGATELARLCETLEHQVRAGDLATAPELVDKIGPEFLAAMDDLAAAKAAYRAD